MISLNLMRRSSSAEWIVNWSAFAAIRQLLDLSHPVSLEPEDMSLRTILRDVETLMKARTLDVCFEVDFQNSDDFVVYFDRGLLIQVLCNLYINAVEAMPAGGLIFVSVEKRADEAIEIVVRDEGDGIQPQVRDGLFESFKTTKRDSGGTGLACPFQSHYWSLPAGRLSCSTSPRTVRRSRLRFLREQNR